MAPLRSNFLRSRCVQALGALALGGVLAGCVVAPAQPGYYGGDTVLVAPPPPRGEIIGVAPAPGYVWLNGYWGWSGGRHQWVGGRWEPGRPGHYWAPHAWVREGGGWRMNGGQWRRR